RIWPYGAPVLLAAEVVRTPTGAGPADPTAQAVPPETNRTKHLARRDTPCVASVAGAPGADELAHQVGTVLTHVALNLVGLAPQRCGDTGDVRGQVPEVAVLEVQDHQATASRVTAHRRVRSNGLLESMISFTTHWYFSSESFSGASVTRAWSATRKSTPCASSMGMEMSTVCQ